MNIAKFRMSMREVVDLAYEIVGKVGQVKLDLRAHEDVIYHQWAEGWARWEAGGGDGPSAFWACDTANGRVEAAVMPRRATISRNSGGHCDASPQDIEEALDALASSIARDLAVRALAGVALRVRAKEKGAFALLKEAARLHRAVGG